ncbi:MAG: diacylglycerol kinase family lipid kinase [Gemmatimonadota bacterium]|jgi:diacylglycerol kinase (ATP)
MAPEGGRAFVIFNPAADGGRGAKRIPRYLELLDRCLPQVDHGISSRPGEEASLAETAIRDGCETVIAVGGDGTWSAVADRILSLGRPGVTLGILPGGTGNDFGRNLGVPGDDPEAAVRILSAGHRARVDAGRILGGTRHEEREVEPREIRFFLNVVGLGFDVAVVEEAKRARFLSGEVLYKVAALKQLFRFPGFSMTLEAEGGQPRSGPTLMLTITNGKFFGGGFPISPGASLQDGALHACHIRDTGPLRRARLFLQAGKGRHERSAEVGSQTASRFRLAFPGPVRFEVDGDVHTTTGSGISVEVCKRALSVLAPET